MIEIHLNHDILIDALQNYVRDNGRGALAELHRVSGVHNISRIAKGQSKATLETWLQLYLSDREHVPPPTTTTGSKIVFIGGDEDVEEVRPKNLSRGYIQDEEKLWGLYARHRSIAVVQAFIKSLEGIEKAVNVRKI